MKHIEPNIIIIDDIREEIQGISEYYSSIGIGCKVFNPDYVDGDLMPEKPYSDVSIIFLDLFYSDKFDAEQCCNWVRSMIREKTFYILILWTKDKSKGEEVLNLLKINNRIPFIYLIRSKIDYQSHESSKFNFLKLFEDIEKELGQSPALEEIQIWKKNVRYASNEILGNLTKYPNNFVDKLRKIILSHGGLSIKESEDNKYKRSVLFEALDIVLASNTKKDLSESISELNINGLYDLRNTENPEIDKELNSWFHFKLDGALSENLITAGLVAKNNHRFFKRLYSIKDDYRIEKLLSKQLQNNIKIDDIVLVISRPCDIAQKKYGKNIKLLSGIILYNPLRKKNQLELDGAKPDSIKIYEHLFLDDDDNDVSIVFDFRYTFSIPEKIFIEKFENIKIFNKELLSEIQVEYASYSNRLGITQVI